MGGPIIVPRRPTDVRTPDPDVTPHAHELTLTARELMDLVAAHHDIRFDSASVDIRQVPGYASTFTFKYWVDRRSEA